MTLPLNDSESMSTLIRDTPNTFFSIHRIEAAHENVR
jgi:hypothetical protein